MQASQIARRTKQADLTQRKGLLDLPPEIWSHIGKLAIDQVPTFSNFQLPDWKSTYHQPPLTRTCRLLREENLPYFYSTRIRVRCVEIQDDTECLLEAIGHENSTKLRDLVWVSFAVDVKLAEAEMEEKWGGEVRLGKFDQYVSALELPLTRYEVRFL